MFVLRLSGDASIVLSEWTKKFLFSSRMSDISTVFETKKSFSRLGGQSVGATDVD